MFLRELCDYHCKCFNLDAYSGCKDLDSFVMEETVVFYATLLGLAMYTCCILYRFINHSLKKKQHISEWWTKIDSSMTLIICCLIFRGAASFIKATVKEALLNDESLVIYTRKIILCEFGFLLFGHLYLT